jgi:hypothetical protein
MQTADKPKRALIVPVIAGPHSTRYALVNLYGDPPLPSKLNLRMFISAENAKAAATRSGYLV